MKKKKIGFLIYSLSAGGAERVLSTVSNGLVNFFDVSIITLVHSDPFYKIDKNVQIISLTDRIEPSKNLIQGLNVNLILIKKLIQVLRREQIEITIGFMTTSNILLTIAAKVVRIPVIISERTNPKLQRLPRSKKLLRKLVYPLANILIVQNSENRDFFLKINPNTIILPNPIAPELSENRDGQSPLKQKIILNVGRLTALKGQDMLIKAFSMINKPEWKLVIVGEGEYRGHLEKLVHDLDLKDQIEMPGIKKNIFDFYNRAEIFAFGSRYEGFPNALIEAMYFGLPCVSTDCPTGPSELIEHGKNGFLIAVDDTKTMANYLKTLTENSDLRKTFSLNAKNMVANFEFNKVIFQWKGVIDNLVK
jgi:GalNAc-alpha-(1->4)-GalNAc-alpha-(1->3)-diNAcBac-PP-undecaprenol alpha-1,4-N-acetyl-D-galactosaminyltransferase